MKKLKRRVLVADDHPVECKALSRIINRQADLTCCGISENVKSMVVAINECLPDLVLLDLNFKDGDGVGLVKSLLQKNPEFRVLVLYQDESLATAEKILKAGGRGYVSKLATVNEILIAIRSVLAGKIYLNEKRGFPAHMNVAGVTSSKLDGAISRLSKREFEVLQLLGSGTRTKNIANELNLSIKTIETYREHLKEKLHLRNSTELIHFAICWKEGQSPSAF
jgi:DNA-binding NarL/FixJ family response regulator